MMVSSAFRQWRRRCLLVFCPFGAATALAMVIAGCSTQSAELENDEHVVTVDVAPASISPISLRISADALLYPLQQAAIVPKISAPVKRFYVDRGSRVRAGQLLAELENRDLESAVAEAQAAYDQAEANYQVTAMGSAPEELRRAELEVQSTKEAMNAQQKLFDNRQTLLREGAISQKEVSDAQVAMTQSKTQYEAAVKHFETLSSVSGQQAIRSVAAQRDAARARVESAEVQLGYSKITSPVDGIVTDRPLYAGEMAQSGNPIVTVMDLSRVIARAHVSQEDARKLRVGNAASLLPSDGSRPVPGKVTVISPALDPSSTTVEVWVHATNPGDRLKPGSSLRVEIVADTVPNALVIPLAAVLTSPSGETSVIVVDSESKPQRRTVELGVRDGDHVQVKQGLQTGDLVVTVGAFELSKLEDDVLSSTTVQIRPGKEEGEDENRQ